MDDWNQAASLLRSARFAVALTGAGVSSESGLDTFRGGGGFWKKFPPERYATLSAFRRNPEQCWKLFLELGRLIERAEPNRAHRILAAWEARGLLKAVITQNVDGLHQRAGSRHVVEFHGSHRRLECLACGAGAEAPAAGETREAPRCSCGAVMKPAVVLFEEAIPARALEEARHLSEACDCLLVIGTSAAVAPASHIPGAVKAPRPARPGGGAVIEINPEKTFLSASDAALRAPASEALARLDSLLQEEQEETGQSWNLSKTSPA
jgi:NAD-dependent deacetylase